MKKYLHLLLFISFVNVAPADENNDPRITPTVKAVAKAMPSVVNIGTERIVSLAYSPWGANDPFEELFRNFYTEQIGRKETSLGSGALISPDGLIVTNSHVVHRATRIIVTTSDGKQYLAKEIAGDTINDIALLQLTGIADGTKFVPISFAPPDALILGEPVIAVGNPYGLGNSISRGVLSAKGRKISFNRKIIFSDILQTDAAINPGNSGGPLININGQMIGINTAIYGEASGIGFAIPLKRIEQLLAIWMIPERFRDVSLGIIPCEKIINNQVVFSLREVIKDSPAWNAGLREGDVISKLNGQHPDSLIGISKILWKINSGDKISIDIPRKGTVVLTAATIENLDGESVAAKRLELGLQKLTHKLAVALNYPFQGGLLVNEITSGNTNIQRGDVLVRIDNTPIYDFPDIRRALNDKHYGDEINALFISVTHKNGHTFISKRNVVMSIK